MGKELELLRVTGVGRRASSTMFALPEGVETEASVMADMVEGGDGDEVGVGKNSCFSCSIDDGEAVEKFVKIVFASVKEGGTEEVAMVNADAELW